MKKNILIIFSFFIVLMNGGELSAQQNVGIGTSSPGSKLQVSGSLGLAWANQTTTSYTLGAGDYYVSYSGSSGGTFNLPAAVSGSGNFQGRIYVLKNATSSYTLTISANGSELIDGVASVSVLPGNTITLISNGATGSATTWNVIGASNAAGSATGWSTKGNSGTTASAAAIGTAVNNNFIGTLDATDFVFATNDLERFRITSAGNLGIGLTSPVQALDVNGAIHLGTTSSAVNGTVRWNPTTKDFEGYDGDVWMSHSGLMDRSLNYTDDGF